MRCTYCQLGEAKAEIIADEHFIVCRAPEGCGKREGMRPLSNGKKTEAEAWAQARKEKNVE